MIVKITSDFYRQITEHRTYEFEKNRIGKWNVSVYLNDQNLNEDEAFISRESGNIGLITEADEFVSKNEQLIKG
jgi:hypothetical protein